MIHDLERQNVVPCSVEEVVPHEEVESSGVLCRKYYTPFSSRGLFHVVWKQIAARCSL